MIGPAAMHRAASGQPTGCHAVEQAKFAVFFWQAEGASGGLADGIAASETQQPEHGRKYVVCSSLFQC